MHSEKYQSKSITPVDDYKCNLSSELLEILENQLHETEEKRNHGIKALRDWTMQNQRIEKTRLDSSWLLKHLRFKKYSIPAAQEAIERHLVLRQGFYGSHFFHAETDCMRPSVKKVFDVHPVCILPESDKTGGPVIFFRLKNVKPDSSPTLFQDLNTALKVFLEATGEIEEFQIRGVNYIFDFSGLTLAYLRFMPLEHMIKIGKNGEKCVAGRHKGFHIINVPSALHFIVSIIISQASKKISERIKVYRSFEELDFIEKEKLPKEYGGTIPMDEMSKSVWELVMKNRDLHMSYQNMQVNEQMYPKACFEGSLEMLKIPLNSDNLFEEAKRCGNDANFGVQGSFRKLEID